MSKPDIDFFKFAASSEMPRLSGHVSARCRLLRDETNGKVYIDGDLLYTYRLDDCDDMRLTWLAIFRRGLITGQEFEDAGLGARRSLQYWVSKSKTGGVAAVISAPRSGGPKRKIDDAMRSKILRLRKSGVKVIDIARECDVTTRSIYLVLKEEDAKKIADQACQGELPLASAWPASTENAGLTVNQPIIDGEAIDESAQAIEAGQEATLDAANMEATLDAANMEATLDAANMEVTLDAASEATSGSLPTPASLPIACLDDTIEAAFAVDRSMDRLAARLGLLDGAQPLFAPAEQVECAGAFLALAVLADDPCLVVAPTIFGRLGRSFFDLRATIITIFLLLILRYRRPEAMRSKDVHALGQLLGLDRLPEVKTLRRKIRQLAALDPAGEFMKAMAAARMAEAPQKPSVVLIDGHVQAYWGTRKVAQTWAPRCGRVVKSVTGNWVHLPGGQPLLAVDSPFNDGLSKMLPTIIKEACRALGQPSITAVFDRGGYKALLFEEMIQAGHKFLTYRKGGDAVDESCFEQRPTIIGDREYAFAPYERQIELTVHIVTASKTPGGRASSRNTGRVITLREIRILRPDKGQTVILTNIGPEETAECLAAILFDRIGSQENSFKYMRSDFGLDERWTYGEEAVPATADHPNPSYLALAKTLRGLQAERNKALKELGASVKKRLTALYPQAAKKDGPKTLDPQAIKKGKPKALGPQATPKDGLKALGPQAAKIDATLAAIEEKIALVQAQMQETPTRENSASAGFVQPEFAARSLINTMRMVAWEVETRLVGLLAGEYSRVDDEGRKLIAAALTTRGSVRLTPGHLVIQLAPQASANRTRAINAVGQRLNEMAIKYPGSGRILHFEATPVAQKRG